MIKKLLGKLKSTPFAKKHIEPVITSILEESFDFDRRIIGSFTDSLDNKSDLYAGLRSKIKPGWQSMLDPNCSSNIPSLKDLKMTDNGSLKRHLSSVYQGSFDSGYLKKITANDTAQLITRLQEQLMKIKIAFPHEYKIVLS